jgi:hypothetical protein
MQLPINTEKNFLEMLAQGSESVNEITNMGEWSHLASTNAAG